MLETPTRRRSQTTVISLGDDDEDEYEDPDFEIAATLLESDLVSDSANKRTMESESQSSPSKIARIGGPSLETLFNSPPPESPSEEHLSPSTRSHEMQLLKSLFTTPSPPSFSSNDIEHRSTTTSSSSGTSVHRDLSLVYQLVEASKTHCRKLLYMIDELMKAAHKEYFDNQAKIGILEKELADEREKARKLHGMV